MKKLATLLFIFLTAYLLPAQTIIDKNYPYKILPNQKIQELKTGNYIFKNIFDFINFRKKADDNNFAEPVFFSEDEIGIIIRRSLTSGTSFKIASVVETENNIIIYTETLKSKGIQSMNMVERIIFLAIKKTDKEIVLEEAAE